MTPLKEQLLLLFEHPQEPVFMPKGEQRFVFELPDDSYLADEYQEIGYQFLKERFSADAGGVLPVKKISIPYIGDILEMDRKANFSLFFPKHRKLAGRLIELFRGMKDLDDLLSFAVFVRDRINPYLFNYALSVALIHRKDAKDITLPSSIQTFPDKYVDSKIFDQARRITRIFGNLKMKLLDIPTNYTATDLEEEHRLAYFREDLGANHHHWHWHLVYPNIGGKEVVAKDRRGELFFYMHQQLIARYNFERLCNKLKRVEKYINWHEPIPEAYFPKLDSNVSSTSYGIRMAGQKLQNIDRKAENVKQDIADLERWRERIFDAIHQRRVLAEDGKFIALTEENGIDLLGNLVEASDLSVNKTYYGDLHNMGHNLIAYIHDPEHKYLESYGVMGDVATAMRDPIFYRWHSFIDDIFQEFKATLPGYEPNQVNFPGIRVTKAEIITQGEKTNTMITYWKKSTVNLAGGMDFQSAGRVFVRFTHLQHVPFTYKITVENKTTSNKMGTCRIFLAPRFDEDSAEWLLRDQRKLFIEVDRFTVSLKQGMNTITRRSDQSTVTIPFERIFPKDGHKGNDTEEHKFCGCGWPEYLLIPKGTYEGMPCELFVMVSNDVLGEAKGACDDAFSFCGVMGGRYPDPKPMGFPFDRNPRKGVFSLRDFLTNNMIAQDVTIRFGDVEVTEKDEEVMKDKCKQC